jgi:hypothetical protein
LKEDRSFFHNQGLEWQGWHFVQSKSRAEHLILESSFAWLRFFGQGSISSGVLGEFNS